MTVYDIVFLHVHCIHVYHLHIYVQKHSQPTTLVEETSKAHLIWMIVAIFMILLAITAAGATFVCSVMYYKKSGNTSKMPLEASASLGKQQF